MTRPCPSTRFAAPFLLVVEAHDLLGNDLVVFQKIVGSRPRGAERPSCRRLVGRRHRRSFRRGYVVGRVLAAEKSTFADERIAAIRGTLPQFVRVAPDAVMGGRSGIVSRPRSQRGRRTALR